MKTKTTLSFTREELETIYFALNVYSIEQIHLSKTWGDVANYIERGGPDVWHRKAEAAGSLQMRVYDAELRMDAKALAE